MSEQVQKPWFWGPVQASGTPLLSAQAGGYVKKVRVFISIPCIHLNSMEEKPDEATSCQVASAPFTHTIALAAPIGVAGRPNRGGAY